MELINNLEACGYRTSTPLLRSHIEVHNNKGNVSISVYSFRFPILFVNFLSCFFSTIAPSCPADAWSPLHPKIVVLKTNKPTKLNIPKKSSLLLSQSSSYSNWCAVSFCFSVHDFYTIHNKIPSEPDPSNVDEEKQRMEIAISNFLSTFYFSPRMKFLSIRFGRRRVDHTFQSH